jgi:hypothetical protein
LSWCHSPFQRIAESNCFAEANAQVFSNGWRTASRSLQGIDPAIGTVLGRIGLLDATELSSVSETAATRQGEWAALSDD